METAPPAIRYFLLSVAAFIVAVRSSDLELDRRLVLLDEASFLRRLKDLEEGERVAVLPLNRASNDEDLLFLRRKSRDDRRRAEEAHVIAAADVVVYEWGDDR